MHADDCLIVRTALDADVIECTDINVWIDDAD